MSIEEIDTKINLIFNDFINFSGKRNIVLKVKALDLHTDEQLLVHLKLKAHVNKVNELKGK